MKIEVTPQVLNMFKMNLHKILMIRDLDHAAQLYVVVELDSVEEEVEIVTKKTWYRDEKITKVKKLYITHLVMETVHPTGKFLGVLTDDACENFIIWHDLYKLRNQWLFMVEQIKAMGFDLVRIEKPVIDGSGSMKPTIPDIKPIAIPESKPTEQS